jgi:hypothetical protein
MAPPMRLIDQYTKSFPNNARHFYKIWKFKIIHVYPVQESMNFNNWLEIKTEYKKTILRHYILFKFIFQNNMYPFNCN